MTQATAKEGAMTTVMNLLNLAADESATPHERELAAERAERLMAKHMIDRMAVQQNATAAQKAKVITDEWMINLGQLDKDGSYNYEYASALISLMTSVVTHCGGRINYAFKYGNKPPDKDSVIPNDLRKDYNIRVYTIVGFPEDIAYAERIWFRVYKDFIMNINPKWQAEPHKLGENVYHHLKAGFKWPEIWRLAWRHQVEMRKTNPNWSYLSTKTARRFEATDPYKAKGCQCVKTAVYEYYESIGEKYERQTQRHAAYKSSFVRSYSATIGNRLDKIRREAKLAKNDEVNIDADKFALALRDTKEQVDEEFYRLFPEYDPRVQERKRQQADMEAWLEAERIWNSMSPEERAKAIRDLIRKARAERARWERESKRARRNYRTVRSNPRDNIDWAAWNRGEQVANRVNLRNDGEVKPETRKAID